MLKYLFTLFSVISSVIKKTKSFSCLVIFLIFTINSQMIFAENIVLTAAENSIPTSYVDNGKQTGILIDVINEAFKRAGHRVEIRLMPWARCLVEVKNGNVDGIFSVYITDEREGFLNYANEVLITQVQAFFVPVNSDITFDGDLKKLEDKRIGIINKTSYGARLDTALKEGQFKNIDLTHNSQSNVKKLLAGRVDLIPSYRHVVLSTAKKLGFVNKIKELSPVLEAIPSYLAFTKKRDFSKIIYDYNKALLSMKKDGTYDILFNKYLQ